jgi:putative endopeptidase
MLGTPLLRFAGALMFVGLAIPSPFDPATMDRTADACKNFFAYATGGWLRSHPIPAAYSEYGYSELLEDETRRIVRGILEAAQANPGTPGGATQKIGTFYATCMNVPAIERLGTAPIAGEFDRIAALRDRSSLTAEIAHLQDIGVDAGFSVMPTQDLRDSTLVIAEVDQSGIGLPERDYYLRTDADSRKLRDRYLAHVEKMLALSGDANSVADARAVLALETQFARASTPAAALRDPEANYHPLSLSATQALMPHFALRAYLADTGVPAGGFLNVAQPKFLGTFDAALAGIPLPTWRAYLRWRLLDAYANALPTRFVDEQFNFNGRILNGEKEQLPRWKRCSSATTTALGEAIGEVYVGKVFPPAAKQDAVDMVHRIRDAYRAQMESLTWMTAATKQTAIAKLDAMGFKVGYPDRWRDYSRYAVRTDSYFGNVERGRTFERHRELAEIGKPVNRKEWFMYPQTVNAYNDTQRNEIVLPAAELQRPFFDPATDDPANLGATGAATVGHEMTHGFDDEGHKFDAHGNLRNWWTPTDRAQFDARANCIVKQFDDTVAVGKIHYQGKLVSGEAIADLGGVVIGYQALESALAGKPRDTVDGFTPEQRYFLAFAQSWTEAVRPEAALTQAQSDPHPLPRDRVNQTLLNVPEWYDAFSCPKPPQALCSIW